jgi:hypothetical protein
MLHQMDVPDFLNLAHLADFVVVAFLTTIIYVEACPTLVGHAFSGPFACSSAPTLTFISD